MRHRHRFTNRSRRLFFPLIALLFFLFLGAVVMLLWNTILPELVGVPRINYAKAVGLLLLCRILFGGFGKAFYMGGNSFGKRSHSWREKWQRMTPEERARMKEKWRKKRHEDPPLAPPFEGGEESSA